MEGEGAGPGRRSAPQPPPRQCAVAHTGPARSTSRHQGASRKQPGDGLRQRRFHRTPPRHGQVPALRSQNLPCESVRPDRTCAEGRPPHQGGQMLCLLSTQPPLIPTPGRNPRQEPHTHRNRSQCPNRLPLRTAHSLVTKPRTGTANYSSKGTQHTGPGQGCSLTHTV